MLSHSEPVVRLLAERGGSRGWRGSGQTVRGRLQQIAPASANKVQRLGPSTEKTTFGTLYQADSKLCCLKCTNNIALNHKRKVLKSIEIY